MTTILLLIPSMQGFGGTERVVHKLSDLFSSMGYKVFIATFDPPGSSQQYVSSVPVHQLGPIPQLPLVLRPISYALAIWQVMRLKRRLMIDVTVSHLWRMDLINALSLGMDKKIALCHTTVQKNVDNKLMITLRPWVAAIYRRLDRVITVSKPLEAELRALYRLSADDISCIENFTDAPLAVNKLPNDGVLRAVWCGRLSAVKNVEGLLYAWNQYVQQGGAGQLLLLGEGPLREELERLTVSLHLTVSSDMTDAKAHVVFLGSVSDPESYMLGARVVLLTSHAEGIPMVILEALALGRPVLAADCEPGGVRSALMGKGDCRPSRTDSEYTSSGALLPVPTPNNIASLKTWADCLSVFFNDSARWVEASEGALAQSVQFSSQVARDKWQEVMTEMRREI
jgi:glycosyltransferase involved in cell wall biosynthesis